MAPALHSAETALGLRCILLLADGGHAALLVEDEPPVAVRVGGLEAEDGDVGAGVERHDHAPQRCRLNQRRVGEDDEHGAGMTLQRRPRRQHRVGGAELLGLLEDLGCRRNARSLGPHRLHIGADHHGDAPGPCRGGSIQRVRQNRAPADAMHDLGQCRAHAHALAGGESNDQERSVDHAGLASCCSLRSPTRCSGDNPCGRQLSPIRPARPMRPEQGRPPAQASHRRLASAFIQLPHL